MTTAQSQTTPKTSPFRLDGQTALITGGGSGLGLGIARSFAAAGAKVVLVGRRQQTLDQACESIGDRAYCRAHDVTDFDRNPALVHEVSQSVGPVSILVNNAGIHLKKPALETTDAEFRSVLDTHVMAAFSLTRAAAGGMIQRKQGAVLLTASMASFLGIPYVIAYTAAKSAYTGMVRGLTAEFAPHGVRVNAIAPGWIESPMLRQALDGDPARTQKILSRTPMARFGDPDDIGNAAVYLCSPAARFVTGVVLPVDGGASIGF